MTGTGVAITVAVAVSIAITVAIAIAIAITVAIAIAIAIPITVTITVAVTRIPCVVGGDARSVDAAVSAFARVGALVIDVTRTPVDLVGRETSERGSERDDEGHRQHGNRAHD
jgi:hypothetical protein